MQFERCVARVLYKSEWATARPAIMRHNNWDKCSSEVVRHQSTPSYVPTNETVHILSAPDDLNAAALRQDILVS